ncbi:Uncharacterised protein [Serratia quinivorans]|uniref:hypothetical protein n=1 Tax=Serratia quinivorans TaxID=137545 RepID=UPI00217A7E5F|nr:hypothetical protein [Serratia quinivorans]CAI1770201.1 Uncharacterised protein [Serratia quinivorans]
MRIALVMFVLGIGFVLGWGADSYIVVLGRAMSIWVVVMSVLAALSVHWMITSELRGQRGVLEERVRELERISNRRRMDLDKAARVVEDDGSYF